MSAVSHPPKSSIPSIVGMNLQIETGRVRLRAFETADVEAIWPYVSDPAVSQYLSWAAHRTREETEAWIEKARTRTETDVVWALEAGGTVVGCIDLHGITWQLKACRVDRAELGFWLAPPLWNRGLMTEAAHAVTQFAFHQIGLHKVMVGCFEANTGSRRVIEKLGFRYIGRQEDNVWRDGTWHAHLQYELTAGEWPDVQTTMRIMRPSV